MRYVAHGQISLHTYGFDFKQITSQIGRKAYNVLRAIKIYKVTAITKKTQSEYDTFPRPAPIIALVGVNISGMPGPPLGPSPLMTTTLP